MPKRAERFLCPVCAYAVSAVVDSRGPQRVRECLKCHVRWLTEEVFKRLARPKKKAA
jgi:transcriptional regulator NrdR family protein